MLPLRKLTNNNFSKEEFKIKQLNTVKNFYKHLEKRNVPPKFWDLFTYRTRKFKDVLDKNKGVFVWGDVGRGKSVFIISLFKWLYLRGIRGKFIVCPEFVMELQDLYNSNRKQKMTSFEYLQDIASSKILFIDDLGVEKSTDYVKQSLYYLLNYREQNLLRTFITSNFSLDYLAKEIDPRLASRISGMCNIVQFTGDDLRLSEVAGQVKVQPEQEGI